MRRTATDCIQRGWASLYANWQLVPLAAVGSLATQALLVASLVPPILVLGGWELLEEAREVLVAGDPVRLETWMTVLADRAMASGTPLVLSLVASTVVGFAFAAVWAFFHGATAGVLVAGDRQAPPAAGPKDGGWRWFRTFSLRDFSGWGGRYLWRFFGFFHVALLVPLLILAAWLLVLVLLGIAFASAGPGAITLFGCLSLLPLGLAFAAFGLWAVLAQPALALGPDTTVSRASGLALGILFRRLGAVLVVAIAFLVPWVFAVVGLVLLELLIQALTGGSTALEVTFFVLQLGTGGALSILLAAMATALVRGESRPAEVAS
jgi:hypothetical protein